MKEIGNKAVELTDEELAKVVGGGYITPGKMCDLECETCTLASAQYLACPRRNSNSSDCKHNR